MLLQAFGHDIQPGDEVVHGLDIVGHGHDRFAEHLDNVAVAPSCQGNRKPLGIPAFIHHLAQLVILGIGRCISDDLDAIADDLQIPDETPPVFLTHASDDTESDVAHSVVMYQALQRKGVPVEMHIYGSGEHDYGVRQNANLTSSWTQLCVNWLR